MKSYLQKFNEQYKGKTSIEIEFFNEEPLTMKYARYNQSGEACSCMVGSNQANHKTKNGWQQVQCDTYNCEHRKKNEYGKSACNRIGWLKFIIPSICKDRIFLMRITGQTSLNRLDGYFNLQKAQGYSIKGKYILFLKQEEQSNSLGKTFNNYVLDILKNEDFNSEKSIPKPIEKNDQNMNNQVVNNTFSSKVNEFKEEKNISNNDIVKNVTENESNKTVAKNVSSKENSKKSTNSKSKKTLKTPIEEQQVTEKEEKITEKEDELKNCYALLSTFYENISDKQYLIGEFADMKDNICNIVVRPEDAIELAKCDLGTFVRLDVSEIKGRKFAMKLEFIEKTLKKVAV